MAQRDEPNVATTSGAYDAMAHRWILVNTVLEGTEAMRAAGESFTPRYERESSQHWEERVHRTVLANFVELTSDHLTGQALKVPPEPDEDVPEDIQALLEDVDGQGTGFATFARNVFKSAVDNAFSHVFVDMPTPRMTEDGAPRTLADDRSEGLRPYWIHVPATSLIFAHSEIIDGKEVLTHIRMREDAVEMDGWAEVVRERIRVVQLGFDEAGNTAVVWELWELMEVSKNKKEWVTVDGGVMDIDEIPLVTFYTAKDGFMVGKPPLTDLAYLNVAHWQSSSDQRNVLTVARFPLLAASGALDEDTDSGDGPIQVGPHSFMYMPDPQGKFYYVEHSGAAIEAGRNDLKDLEEQMAGYGSEFLKQRPANEGVTARVLDSSESLSSLQVWVIDFKDALENCFRLTAKWLGKEEDGGGSVLLDSDEIGLDEADTAHLDTLVKARAARDISRHAFLTELKRRGVLSDAFDIDEDEGLRDDEAPSEEMAGMFGPGGEMNAPGQQPDDDEDEDEDDATTDEA